MNKDQKRIVDSIMKAVDSNNNPKRMFVSGEAGTGKSVIIKILTYLIKKNTIKL